MYEPSKGRLCAAGPSKSAAIDKAHFYYTNRSHLISFGAPLVNEGLDYRFKSNTHTPT